MREILTTEETYNEIFQSTLKTLAKLFQTDLSKQRMDSVHIQSNMRRLGRSGLFVKTIKKFLINLKRQYRGHFDQLDNNLTNRYLGKSQDSLFAMVKPTDSVKTLDQLAEDTQILTERFAASPGISDMSSFKLLVRLFSEQCVMEEPDKDSSATARKSTARPNKEVPSDSLQNPSDPDVGYSGHKGHGYQVQVVENYSPTNSKQLSLITSVTVESADQHDANALLPALSKLQQQGMLPEEILADSLYGSDTNRESALQEHGVAVISPVMPGNQKKMHLSDFVLDNQGDIVLCPQGVAPERIKKNSEGLCVAFPVTCHACLNFELCPVGKGKKSCYYRNTEKDVLIARRRKQEKTDAFKEK